MCPHIVRGSLPHLAEEERTDLLSRYLGTTIWQAIVERFDLPSAVLAETIDC